QIHLRHRLSAYIYRLLGISTNTPAPSRTEMRTGTIQMADLQDGGRLKPLIKDHRAAFVWSLQDPRLLWANEAGEKKLGKSLSQGSLDHLPDSLRTVWTQILNLVPRGPGGLTMARIQIVAGASEAE